MKKLEDIIINASYKDFFGKITENLRKDQFITPQLEEYASLDNISLTKAIALALKEKDLSSEVFYGVEIKSNGSSRSGRIPLVRATQKNASIWKVSSRVEDLEKTTTALNDLFYFLKNHNDYSYPLPVKVIVLREDENLYAIQEAPHYRFVKDLIKKSDVILFSLQLIKKMIRDNKLINLNSYLKKSGRIFTTISK